MPLSIEDVCNVQLYGGALLATAARLKWDPSTYVVLRELFPAEYRAAAISLTGAGALLLLLAHLAAAAHHAQRDNTRRLLYYTVATSRCDLTVACHP